MINNAERFKVHSGMTSRELSELGFPPAYIYNLIIRSTQLNTTQRLMLYSESSANAIAQGHVNTDQVRSRLSGVSLINVLTNCIVWQRDR